MSKQLEKLIEKALYKGEAVVNGRKSYWGGNKGELEEKYAIVIEGNILKLRHWGTETLAIDTCKKKVLEWYGESNSDRDSMNYIKDKFGIEGMFRYRPSIDEFSYE